MQQEISGAHEAPAKRVVPSVTLGLHFGRIEDGRGVCSAPGVLTPNLREVTCPDCKARVLENLAQSFGLTLYRAQIGRAPVRYMYTAPDELTELGHVGSGVSHARSDAAALDSLKSLHAFLGEMLEVLS